MKLGLIIYLGVTTVSFSADLKVPPLSLAVFGGGQRPIPFTIKNVTQQTIDRELTVQLLQATATTIAPIQTVERWKRLVLLPQQSVNDEATIEVPSVRAATRFLFRVAEGRSVIGDVEVWAYPSNLLSELTRMLGGESVMLCETPEEWKTLLRMAGIPFREAAPDRLIFARSKLAVVGPLPDEEMLKIKNALRKPNAAQGAIILKNPPTAEGAVLPSYYLSNFGGKKAVFAMPQTLTNLSTDPWAQLRFLQMAKLATASEDLLTPEFSH